jgi:hypothetical protein
VCGRSTEDCRYACAQNYWTQAGDKCKKIIGPRLLTNVKRAST